MKAAIAAAIVLLVAAGVFALRPVCVPIDDADVSTFTIPVEQRTDRDFYVRVFQQRNGRWHQCKTWISRRLFL